MEDNAKLIESILGRTTDYVKTSIQLVKLKALEKSTDVVSSVIPYAVAVAIFSLAMLFLNVGLALWIGEILGEIFYGFLVIAAFYCIVAIIFHFFMHKWLKKFIGNYIIKNVLS
jgi:phosphoglycerol transferase MdoB-like AlkP superfamily enzyme